MSQTLAAYIEAKKLDALETMNLLQHHGIISDNCVDVCDVGNGGEAVAWLERRDP